MAVTLCSPVILLLMVLVQASWGFGNDVGSMVTLEDNITTVYSFQMKIVSEESKNVTIVSIPRSDGCSFVCSSSSLESHSELVRRVADKFFSESHTVTGELKLEGTDTQMFCRNETVDGHLNVKCDATTEGEFFSVVIDHLQQTSSLPISCSHTVVDNGVEFKCQSSNLLITGLSYFINAKPISVTDESTFLIGWDSLNSVTNIVSLGVCVSSGQVYPLTFNVTLELWCDVELIEEYQDLGNAFQFTSQSRNCNATEIISVTISHSKKEWTTKVDGGVFTIPKYILDTRVNILFLEFRVMFGSKIIVLKRILEIINPLEPLKLSCRLESSGCRPHDCGVQKINCFTNREVTALCSIDAATVHEECNLNYSVDISTLRRGKHEFRVKATDSYGNTAMNKVVFPVDFALWCNTVYDYTHKSITVSCDSTRPISSSTLQVNDDTPIKGSLPYTVPFEPSAKEISLKIVAQDQFGDKAIDVIYDSNILL